MSDTPTTAPEASTKRRALLKGAGVAAAAGGTPLIAMATNGQRLVTSTGAGGAYPVIVCSLSGWQSFQNAQRTGQYKGGAFLSGTPGGTTCGGYSPGWWGQNPNSKAVRWTGGMASLPDVPYTTALPGGALKVNNTTATMWQVMSQSTFASHNDRHWLCAWLNARSNEVSYPYNANDNFPFTSQQITSFYLEGNNDALNFIKAYLETHT